MGQDTQELRREIENTRGDLGGTIDEIEDRVSPRRIAQRRKSRMKESIGGVRDRVMGTAQTAVGGVTDAAHGVTDRVSGAGGTVSDTASNAAGTARNAPQAAIQQTEGNPLLAGVVAAGVGFLASVIFPGTQAEGQAVQKLQEKAQPLKDEAKNVGQQMASSLQEHGQQAAQEMKGTVSESGQQIKDTAQQSAQQTKEAGQQGASDVAQDVKWLFGFQRGGATPGSAKNEQRCSKFEV